MTQEEAVKKADALLASGKVHNAVAQPTADGNGWEVRVKGRDGLWSNPQH